MADEIKLVELTDEEFKKAAALSNRVLEAIVKEPDDQQLNLLGAVAIQLGAHAMLENDRELEDQAVAFGVAMLNTAMANK